LIMAAVLVIAGAAYAALDATLLQNAVILKPQEIAGGAAQVTSTVVDKMPFTGVANIVLALGVNTGATMVVQLQTAPASTGTFANVTGKTVTLTGTNGTSDVIGYDMTSGNRYLRVTVTNTSATAQGSVSGTINSFK